MSTRCIWKRAKKKQFRRKAFRGTSFKIGGTIWVCTESCICVMNLWERCVTEKNDSRERNEGLLREKGYRIQESGVIIFFLWKSDSLLNHKNNKFNQKDQQRCCNMWLYTEYGTNKLKVIFAFLLITFKFNVKSKSFFYIPFFIYEKQQINMFRAVNIIHLFEDEDGSCMIK